MRSFLMGLLVVPSLVFAGDNSFMEQDLSKIQQQNAQVNQRMTQSNQQTVQQNQQVQKGFDNNNAMRTLLYTPTTNTAKSSGKQPIQQPQPVQAQQQPEKPVQYTTPAPKQTTNTDNVTGLNQSDTKSDDSSSQGSGWNYGY